MRRIPSTRTAQPPVAIVEAVRTPIGRGRADGCYAAIHANELLGSVYLALIERAGIDPSEVDAVLGGCVHQVGEHATNITRNAWLQAGLPVETAATTVEVQCGSGQHAVNLAAAQIAIGAHDIMIAAGVEHMGHVPMFSDRLDPERLGTPWPAPLLARFPVEDQGMSAELMCERWSLSREDLDEFALGSHRRAAWATDSGRFEQEIVPVEVDDTVRSDEGIRRDTTPEKLAALRPVFRQDGRVTAGNSSQISDGAAGVLLMSAPKAAALGLRPRAFIVDQTIVGVDPVLMLTGPIEATKRLLDRNRLRIDDLDRIEVNEAFASVVLAWERELGANMEDVNVNGGAIALGHALGSTGPRLITTLVHELQHSDGELGLVTMCCGGGIGTGTLFRRA
jgi:acetyl-CoA acyltransferase